MRSIHRRFEDALHPLTTIIGPRLKYIHKLVWIPIMDGELRTARLHHDSVLFLEGMELVRDVKRERCHLIRLQWLGVSKTIAVLGLHHLHTQ